MKFLHTGDLHLGKFFYEHPLIEEQKFMLSSIINELVSAKKENTPYDALLICGDIYDRSIPPVDAVTLFSSFLGELKQKLPELFILIISGNHDSAVRLSYASDILEYQRIIIRTDASKITEPVIINGTAFYLLPFLFPGSIEKKKTIMTDSSSNSVELSFNFGEEENNDELLSQSAMIEEAVSVIKKAHQSSHETQNLPAVLCAHLFTAGSVPSSSERTIWGNAEQVDVHQFDFFFYTALGHLHRFQKASAKTIYAGSPLAYSFDESLYQKVLLKVEYEQKQAEPKITELPITPLRPVVSLSGSFDDFYKSNKYDEYKNFFIEIKSTDTFITENPVSLLRTKFPYLLSYKQEKAVADIMPSNLMERRNAINESNGDLKEQFSHFLNEIHDSNDDFSDDKIKLFSTLYEQMKEKIHETN